MNVKIGHFQAPLFRSEKLWIDLLSFKGILYNLVCKLTLDEIGIDTKPTL